MRQIKVLVPGNDGNTTKSIESLSDDVIKTKFMTVPTFVTAHTFCASRDTLIFPMACA